MPVSQPRDTCRGSQAASGHWPLATPRDGTATAAERSLDGGVKRLGRGHKEEALMETERDLIETERDLIETGKNLEETEREREGEEKRSGGRGVMRMKLHKYSSYTEVINYKPFTNRACS